MGRPWIVSRSRRKDAVFACDQMASSNTRDGVGPACEIENNVSAKPDVIVLAKAAFDAVFPYCSQNSVREVWAEAGQILRDGWIPGMELMSMQESLEQRIRQRDRIAPPDASSPEEAKLDLIVEEKHDRMNAALVPENMDNLNMRTHEVRKIDDGPAEPFEGLPELEAMNQATAAALDLRYKVCEDPKCPALEHPEDLHSHPVEPVTFEDEDPNAPTMEEMGYEYTEPEDAGAPVSKPTTDG